MAELTPKERLQPSLLDRLTDDHPGTSRESRDRRVLSPRKLREVVVRDLGFLLNTSDMSSLQDLSDYPMVAESTLNYGMRDLAGLTAASVDIHAVEKAVQEAIQRYEPRLYRSSIEVRALLSPEEMSHNALSFEISGELWGDPLPLHLYLRTQIDLENGNVTVHDSEGRNSNESATKSRSDDRSN